MRYESARQIAEDVVQALRPYCERIEIAGSIRRRAPDCGDVEIVLVPRGRDLPALARAVEAFTRVKGHITGRYTQRRHHGMTVDIFIVENRTWGLQFAIRTGPARYSHGVLARGWALKGYTSEHGILYRVIENNQATKKDDILDREHPLYFFEERDLFNFLGLRYVHPEMR